MNSKSCSHEKHKNGRSEFWHVCGHFPNLIHGRFTVWWPENAAFQFWFCWNTKNSNNPHKKMRLTQSSQLIYLCMLYTACVNWLLLQLTGNPFFSLKFNENSFLSKRLTQPLDTESPGWEGNIGVHTFINLLIIQTIQAGE